MKGYRNFTLALCAIATTSWLVYVGLKVGADLLSLATVIGAKDATLGLIVFGRGYNKGQEAKNGGVQ